MITKKDLIGLGDVLKEAEGTELGLSEDQLEMIAGFLQRNNPRFLKQRWIGYVRGQNGPNGGVIHEDDPE